MRIDKLPVIKKDLPKDTDKSESKQNVTIDDDIQTKE